LADIAIVNVAPTALKSISKYIKSLNAVKQLPYWAVETILSFEEDCDWPVLEFIMADLLNGSDVKRIAEGLSMYKDMVAQPFNVAGYEPPNEVATAPAEEKRKSKVS